MKTLHLYVCALALCASISQASAAELKGIVIDPSGHGIAGAQVAVIHSLGVITQQTTNDEGKFSLYVSPLFERVQLRAAAQGFQTATVPAGVTAIRLAIAPVSDSIRVAASAIDVAASEQGSSVSVITSQELRERNEPLVLDVLRQSPGLVVLQSGGPGTVGSLFVRGGDSKYNLALLNGIPVNSFYYGGLFDFAHLPSDAIEEIQIARGPQSAIYGSYALGSVVSFKTRSPENGPSLDLLAEGGTHAERRFAVNGAGMARNWGLAASLSSLNTDGSVRNGDYRGDNALLSLQHRWSTQNLYAFGAFASNETGEPGPYGSNPKGYFSGLDTISRSKNNTATYGAHYRNDLTRSVRADGYFGYFRNNNFYASPYGGSFSRDLRWYADGRITYNVGPHWTAAAGYSFDREEVKNTYITVTSGSTFPLRRDNSGEYLENYFALGRLFLNAGMRIETYRTPLVPGNAFGFPARPDFPARTESKVSPKFSAAYAAGASTRLHASYGTGIRPPGGSDLAFTDNPALLAEQTRSYDLGIEQKFARNRLSIDATWFYNRYDDLIVGLGGSLAVLSKYSTDNLSNARARGLEFSAQLRPASWVSLNGSYTWLETRVLSLDGGNGLVQRFYTLGQPLLRRPKQSGSMVATFRAGRADLNLLGEFRGKTLDVEPNFGTSGGFFVNGGHQNFGVNLNYRVRANLTVYTNLRNAFNQRYEEIYGFPSPLLNVVAGVKWNLARAR